MKILHSSMFLSSFGEITNVQTRTGLLTLPGSSGILE
jgi:hypothetical protein